MFFEQGICIPEGQTVAGYLLSMCSMVTGERKENISTSKYSFQQNYDTKFTFKEINLLPSPLHHHQLSSTASNSAATDLC